ncbi:MAG: hypothetical protein ACI9XB_004456, partial [Gammaproteobacteria bacterium]
LLPRGPRLLLHHRGRDLRGNLHDRVPRDRGCGNWRRGGLLVGLLLYISFCIFYDFQSEVYYRSILVKNQFPVKCTIWFWMSKYSLCISSNCCLILKFWL